MNTVKQYDFNADREFLKQVHPGPYYTCAFEDFKEPNSHLVAKCFGTDVYRADCDHSWDSDCPYHMVGIEAEFFVRATVGWPKALERIKELEEEINRLREALSWTVGFIRCNLPKTSSQYEDMRNAEDLLKDNVLFHGEFNILSNKVELQSEVIKRVLPYITELLTFQKDYFGCYYEEGCYICDLNKKFEVLKKELEELT